MHVDVALPDFKVAFFLQGAAPSPAAGGGGARGWWGRLLGWGVGGGGEPPLRTLDPEGAVLRG